MDRLAEITEFVVVSNLENRAINAGINKAQNWWKNRHNSADPVYSPRPEPMYSPRPDPMYTPQPEPKYTPRPEPKVIPQDASPPIDPVPGQLLITVISAQDLRESRLSMITGSSSERPYVVVDCNQQRFQTMQADSHSSNRNPQWTSGNGPFGFDIFNPTGDRVTIWVQQHDALRVIRHGQPKILGMCEVNVGQLIGQKQAWLALRKDNRPAGQLLIRIVFIPKEPLPPKSPMYNRVL
jgi:hypothetical protein